MAKKRCNNEGTIFQLQDGKWCGFVSLGYRNGKRWRKKFKANTQREVVEKVSRTISTLAKEGVVSTDRQTVADYLRSWLRDSVQNSVRPGTYASYRDNLERYIIPRIGRIELTKLRPQHVRACLNEMRNSGGIVRNKINSEAKWDRKPLSSRTIQYCRSILRHGLRQAVEDRIIETNPAALTKGPRLEQHEIHPYTPKQARTLLDAVKNDRLEALFTVAVALGLRQGEILGLRWQDLDLRAGRLTVRYQLQRIDKKLMFVALKTKKSKRTLVLPALAISALLTHRSRQEQERQLAGDRWQEWGLVFSTSIGTPMDSPNLNHRFQQIATRAGLPRLRFHDLRHTAATLALVQGVHPRLVMATLGHSQISLTMNTYSHYIPEEMGGQLAKQMDDILSTPTSALLPHPEAAEESVATQVATQALSRVTHQIVKYLKI